MFVPKSRELLTYKAGKWDFTASCDEAEIYPLLVRARTLFDAVSAIPLLPKWRSRLQTEILARSIHGTASIEGNPLTQEEVAEELSETNRPMKSSSDAEKEIGNLCRLYERLKVVERPEEPLNEKLVRSFHATITDGLAFEDNIPGQYRNSPVIVGDADHGGVYKPPKERADVIQLMTCFSEWLNGEDMQQFDPMLRAACAHYYLVRIHPFRDGNGRTARFAEAYILSRAGMQLIAPLLSNYYCLHKDDYFCVISETAKKKEMTPFFRFMLTAAYESLKNVQKEILPSIDFLLMRELAAALREKKKITERQKSLLDVMLTSVPSVTLDELYAHPALRGYYAGVSRVTARRDLAKLSGMNVLTPVDDRMIINFNILKI